jgi:hypothetical protein
LSTRNRSPTWTCTPSGVNLGKRPQTIRPSQIEIRRFPGKHSPSPDMPVLFQRNTT